MIGDLDVAAALVRGSRPGTVQEAKRLVLYRRGVAVKDEVDRMVEWLEAADDWLRGNPTAADYEAREDTWITALIAYERARSALDRARSAL